MMGQQVQGQRGAKHRAGPKYLKTKQAHPPKNPSVFQQDTVLRARQLRRRALKEGREGREGGRDGNRSAKLLINFSHDCWHSECQTGTDCTHARQSGCEKDRAAESAREGTARQTSQHSSVSAKPFVCPRLCCWCSRYNCLIGRCRRQ